MFSSRRFGLLAAVLLLGPVCAFAGTVSTIEGGEAEKLYEKEKGTSLSLVQANTTFTLRQPGKDDVVKPATIDVKVGQNLFLLNEEHGVVHNVYDNTDNSWVLQKQEPGKVAVIRFSKAGEHKLRCAIHPQMKVTVNVTN